jgi:hypothetical protein
MRLYTRASNVGVGVLPARRPKRGYNQTTHIPIFPCRRRHCRRRRRRRLKGEAGRLPRRSERARGRRSPIWWCPLQIAQLVTCSYSILLGHFSIVDMCQQPWWFSLCFATLSKCLLILCFLCLILFVIGHQIMLLKISFFCLLIVEKVLSFGTGISTLDCVFL